MLLYTERWAEYQKPKPEKQTNYYIYSLLHQFYAFAVFISGCWLIQYWHDCHFALSLLCLLRRFGGLLLFDEVEERCQNRARTHCRKINLALCPDE